MRPMIAGGTGNIALIDDGSASSGTQLNSSTATITGLSSTGPHTFLLLTGGCDATALSFSSVTFGGNSCTSLVFVQDAGNQAWAAIYYIAGSQTGNIVVTTSGTPDWDANATIVSLINLQNSSPVDTDSASNASATALSLSALTSPGTGGIRLVAFAHDDDTNGVTPTNATEIDDEDGGAARHWTAYDEGPNATTITATSAGAANNCAMVGVSMR